jgi:fructoselysine 6-kinase
MRFLAATVFCVDFFKTTGEVLIGGNSLNFAVQCANSGMNKVSLLGAVGNDKYGELVKKYLARFRFDSSHLYTRDGRTASNKIYNDENGDRYFPPDSWDDGVYGVFMLSEEDWAFAGEHDVIAMPANNPNFAELLKRKSEQNKLAIDFLDMRDYKLLEQALPKLDLLFISGNNEVIQSLLPLSKTSNALLVVTMGAAGSTVISSGHTYTTAAVQVNTVIDTTGCGDAYIAAFCVDWYCGGNIKTAMEAGSQAASKVLAYRGGVENGLMAVLP